MASPALRYKDKVTIVTGGSKGIGEGVVRVFGEYWTGPVLKTRGNHVVAMRATHIRDVRRPDQK